MMRAIRLLSIVLSLVVVGCASVPRQEFDEYVRNFNTARSTAQDIILLARVDAEKSNDGTRKAQAQLAQRNKAITARLAALDVISQYNDALLKLATPTDAASVKASLEGVSESLGAFRYAQMASLAANVVPYLGFISEAVSAIDNSMRAEDFAAAVSAAGPAIERITIILEEDAADMALVHEQHLLKKRDLEEGRLITVGNELQKTVNVLESDAEVEAAIRQFNTAVGSMPEKDRPRAVRRQAAAQVRAANATDEALLQTLALHAAAQAAAFNRIDDQIRAHAAVIDEYRKMLAGTRDAFVLLERARRNNQRATLAAFTETVLNLRKAYIELQEAK